jgi:hypothetical protein
MPMYQAIYNLKTPEGHICKIVKTSNHPTLIGFKTSCDRLVESLLHENKIESREYLVATKSGFKPPQVRGPSKASIAAEANAKQASYDARIIESYKDWSDDAIRAGAEQYRPDKATATGVGVETLEVWHRDICNVGRLRGLWV